MGRIKSALELAMERTDGIAAGRDKIEEYEARQEGKRVAGLFLDAENPQEMKKLLSAFKGAKLDSVKRGLVDVLVARIRLPDTENDLPVLERVGLGLSEVLQSPIFDRMYGQLAQAFSSFLTEMARYEDAIRKQYLPKLRQKEEELARRTGRMVQLDPMQDPEFVAFYNQHVGALREQYQQAVDQVREQIVQQTPFMQD